jgi:hypothetical protein
MNRNKITKVGAKKLKQMLVENEFLEILEMEGLNLGNEGF